MASNKEDKKSSSKLFQKTSEVKFDLDGSQHTDDAADESLDEVVEFLGLSSLSKNPSSSSFESTTNGAVLHKRLSSNNENKSTAKRYTR
jgi:hypothetical protein